MLWKKIPFAVHKRHMLVLVPLLVLLAAGIWAGFTAPGVGSGQNEESSANAIPPLPNDSVQLEEGGTPPEGVITREQAINEALDRFLFRDEVLGNPEKYPIAAQFKRYTSPEGPWGPQASQAPVWVVTIENWVTVGPQFGDPEDYKMSTIMVVDANTGRTLYGFERGEKLP